jgi:hypothetical protein
MSNPRVGLRRLYDIIPKDLRQLHTRRYAGPCPPRLHPTRNTHARAKTPVRRGLDSPCDLRSTRRHTASCSESDTSKSKRRISPPPVLISMLCGSHLSHPRLRSWDGTGTVKVKPSPFTHCPWPSPGAHIRPNSGPRVILPVRRMSERRMTDRQGPVSCVPGKGGSLHSFSSTPIPQAVEVPLGRHDLVDDAPVLGSLGQMWRFLLARLHL